MGTSQLQFIFGKVYLRLHENVHEISLKNSSLENIHVSISLIFFRAELCRCCYFCMRIYFRSRNSH